MGNTESPRQQKRLTGRVDTPFLKAVHSMLKSFAILGVLALAGAQAFAQTTAHASLCVIGQVEGSMSIEFTVGATTRNAATGSHSASFTIPVFGGSFSQGTSPVAGGDTDFLISSPFGITVLKANLPSSSYTLRASLTVPDRIHVWKIDRVDISAGSDQVITTSESYATNNPHTLAVSGNSSDPQQSLGRDLRFTVIAN